MSEIESIIPIIESFETCDISLVSLSNETQLVTKGANLGARTITIFLRTDGLSVVSGASG